MSTNLIIGSSHSIRFTQYIGSIEELENVAGQEGLVIKSRLEDEFILFYMNPSTPFLSYTIENDLLISHYHGDAINKIRELNKPGNKTFFQIGGNEHNSYFFIENKLPFDFFDPSIKTIIKKRQVIPRKVIVNFLRKQMSYTQLSLGTLSKELSLTQKYFIAPPPPIPSEEHIKKSPEVFNLEKDVLEDKYVRLKIYNIYTELLQEFCEMNDVLLIKAPEDTLDSERFLKEEYWYHSTHAQPNYYGRVLHSIGLPIHAPI